MNSSIPSSFSNFDNVYLQINKNPFNEKKNSLNNLTLSATKASIVDSATKSYGDLDSMINKDFKSVTLPSLDVLPTSLKSKVNPNTSFKQTPIVQKFDNQLQSYFQTAKSSNPFFSLCQTQAPSSPDKQDRIQNSYVQITPQQSSKYHNSMNSLSDFPSYVRSQKVLELTPDVHRNSKSDNQRSGQFVQKQQMNQSQNVFNIQKQSIKFQQLLDIDVLKDKQKIVQLINKDRKVKQINSSVGKSRQTNNTIIEKVKREEKNFYVTFSINDTKAHKLLKNVKYNPKNITKIRKNINSREKRDFQCPFQDNCCVNQTQQPLNLDQEKQLVDFHSSSADNILQQKDNQYEQFQKEQDNQQHKEKVAIIIHEEIDPIPPSSPLKMGNIEQIQEINDEESPSYFKQKQQNEIFENMKYESLLTPIKELNSYKQSNSSYKLDSTTPQNSINLKDQQDEIKIFERQTSIFQTNDKEFLKVTIIGPESDINLQRDSNTPIKKDSYDQSSFFSEDDILRRESSINREREDSNQLDPTSLYRKTSSSRHSDKNVLFDLGQDSLLNKEITPLNLQKKQGESGQIQGILKKKTMLSQDGTDQSEYSDFTATNKQQKISFAHIKKQKTINTKTGNSPRKSYFKSFSQAINDDLSDVDNADNEGDSTFKNKIREKLGIPQKQQQKFSKNNKQLASSEYADDEFKDRSESNYSQNTSFFGKGQDQYTKNGFKRSKTNLKSENSIDQLSPDSKQTKFKAKLGRFKSNQTIDGDESKIEKDQKRLSIKTEGSKDRLILKDLNKVHKNKKVKSKSRVQITDSSDGEDINEGDQEFNNDNDESYTRKSQEGGTEHLKKKKSRKYSLQLNDLAEFIEMQSNNKLTLSSIATLFVKLHKAKKNALIHLKQQPTEPVRLNEIDVSSGSDLEDLSLLKHHSKKSESQSNFNDYYEDYDADSQTHGSFVIPSLGEHLGDIDSPLESGSNMGEGTSKNLNKKHILQKMVSKKSFSQHPNKQNQKILSLKSKLFEKTPSNNFDLRNIRKNEMHLLKQKIENIHKEFRIEGLNLDQKKQKMRKLIKEIQKMNAKKDTQESKQTENLISAIVYDLDYEKQSDEAYFQEIMSNAPLINEDLQYFAKLRQNKINDPVQFQLN